MILLFCNLSCRRANENKSVTLVDRERRDKVNTACSRRFIIIVVTEYLRVIVIRRFVLNAERRTDACTIVHSSANTRPRGPTTVQTLNLLFYHNAYIILACLCVCVRVQFSRIDIKLGENVSNHARKQPSIILTYTTAATVVESIKRLTHISSRTRIAAVPDSDFRVNECGTGNIIVRYPYTCATVRLPIRRRHRSASPYNSLCRNLTELLSTAANA